MRYIIMCAGKGTRWNNYKGVPKHLIEINGETLIGRTTRLLKENGINDYVITSSDERYKQYGKTIPQSFLDCEVDRFEATDDDEICYLYGDVYYTENAIKTIINTPTDEILFFGSYWEIFAIKVVNTKLFFYHKYIVKDLFLKGEINRCIGWEVYRSLNNIPFDIHEIKDRYIKIEDKTTDIDFPADYEAFVNKYKLKLTVIIPVYNQEDLVIKALKSIPIRDDIEIIVIDDGSTDDTWQNLMKYREECNNQNLIYLYNEENKGVSYTVNKGYDYAKGEYIVLLGSDDYFYTEEFEKALEYLDGTDLIYFNLKKNDGSIMKLTQESKNSLCGSTKFMRREFIGDTRCPEDKRIGEDYFFYQDLLKKNPTEKFTDITLKHYNYPREGSLTYIAIHGGKNE